MLASLDLLTTENGRVGSVLQGIVDAKRVGTVGHSLGGLTAFDALSDPRLKVAVGWAPNGPSGTPVDKPTMIIGASNDIAYTPATLAQTYASFPAPKRRVEIAKAGHNTFTDTCVVIRAGGGLIEFARSLNLVSEGLLKLGTNGCEATDPDPLTIWPVIQHFTVAELRSVLGIDPQPVGLGPGIDHAFGAIGITYEQEAKLMREHGIDATPDPRRARRAASARTRRARCPPVRPRLSDGERRSRAPPHAGEQPLPVRQRVEPVQVPGARRAGDRGDRRGR